MPPAALQHVPHSDMARTLMKLELHASPGSEYSQSRNDCLSWGNQSPLPEDCGGGAGYDCDIELIYLAPPTTPIESKRGQSLCKKQWHCRWHCCASCFISTDRALCEKHCSYGAFRRGDRMPDSILCSLLYAGVLRQVCPCGQLCACKFQWANVIFIGYYPPTESSKGTLWVHIAEVKHTSSAFSIIV